MPLSFWGDIGKWAGGLLSPASNTSGDGSRVMPDVRNNPRKFGQILFFGTLPANAKYISQWFDTYQTGAHFVEVSRYSEQAGASNGFQIQQTNDPSNTNLNRISAQTGGAQPAVGLFTLESVLKSRYWRILYTNGATITTQLEIAYTESTEIPYQTIAGATPNGDTISVQGATQSLNQNGAQTCGLQITDLTTSSSPDQASGSNALGFQTNINGLTTLPASVSFGVTSGGTLPGMTAFRIPTTFKTSTAVNAGNTAAWTPAAGKKFRLMRYQLELTENATLAVAAVLTVKFQDNVTDFGFQHDIFVAAAAGAVSGEAWRSGWIDIGNGYLSTVANNVLNFNISGAANLTAGQFRINVCGTEE